MSMMDHEVTGSAWQQAHEGLVRLATKRAGLDFEEGQALRAALRVGAHERLGYGSFIEYIERLFGYSPRLTYEKLRVAEALEGLGVLAVALCEGQVSWSVARELTRVATPETEQAWLASAAGLTARQVQQRVSGHQPGSLPDDPTDETARRHVLRFEVSGEAFAAFREAMACMRREAGGPLDDDAALLLLARHALGGPLEGRSSYQVALTVCEKCRQATQDAQGEVVAVGPEVLEMAECDGQHLGCVHGDGVVADDRVGDPVADAHVGATVGTNVGTARDDVRQKRATQTIPPALRRLVLRRDRHRCVFPGCRHATFVDVHHLRGRGGRAPHTTDNLVTLCGAHHRAVHRGAVVVEGVPATGLTFRHADGTAYGGPVTPLAVEVQARAFQALRGMGFGESEVRRALGQVQQQTATPTNIETVLRHALRELTERRVSKVA